MSRTILPDNIIKDMVATENRVAQVERIIASENPQVAFGVRANHQLMNGGTITWTGTDFSWSARFIVIAAGQGLLLTTNGHFDISMPPDGTTIFGVGGASDLTVGGGAVPLSETWGALYYILPLGETNASLSQNFRHVRYGIEDFTIPSHWVLIAQRHDSAPAHLVVNTNS